MWKPSSRDSAASSVKSEMTYLPSNVTLARPKPTGDYERMVTRADEMRRVVTVTAIGATSSG